MGTSYVEYRDCGFWTRDIYLSGWLTSLFEEIIPAALTKPWLQPLIDRWEEQILIDGGCMNLALDRFLQENERCDFILSAADAALVRTPDTSKRTGQLFIALLRRELKTDGRQPN